MNKLSKEFEKFAKSNGVSSTTLDKYKKTVASLTPAIVEESTQNLAIMDVFSRMMKDRVIFLGTEIDEYVANCISAQLLFLNTNFTDDDTDIKMYINSPGGSVYDGNSILDVMDILNHDVATVCTGMAASMAAVILSNGTRGKRFALKRSRVMIHQPLGGSYGQASDIEIAAVEMKRVKVELITTLSDNSGQLYSKVFADCDRDNWMSSNEALEYGLIDKILSKKK